MKCLRITSINLATKSICGTEIGENDPKIAKSERLFLKLGRENARESDTKSTFSQI